MAVDPKQTRVTAQWKTGGPLICCRFDPQGRFVFAGGEDYAIHRFDAQSGEQTLLSEHDCWVRGLAFSADGESMISAGSDGQLVWWPAAAKQPKPMRRVQAHDGWIRTVNVSSDGRLLASAGNDLVLRLWDLESGELAQEFSQHESHIYSTFFHPGGEYLLSGTLQGKARQFELAGGKLVREFDVSSLHTYNGGQRVHYGGVRSMALSPDGKHFACGGLHKATNPLGAVNEPLVELFDWESQKKTKSLIAGGDKGIIWRVAFHRDNFLIGVSGGSGGGLLLFWTPAQDKPLHKLKLPNTARDMDVHPDGVRIATAHHDRHLRISTMAAANG